MMDLRSFLYQRYKNRTANRASEKAIASICNSVKQYCKIQNLTKSQIEEIQDYWQPLVGKRVDTRLHQMMFSLTGIFKPEFEPFEICHQVQARSMHPRAMFFFDDKNLYRSLLFGFSIPERIAECINGVCYLPGMHMDGTEISKSDMINALRNISDCIIKPSVGSDGGRGVHSFDSLDGIEINTKKTVEDVIREYGLNFCIERKVHECDNLQILNPTSCNTLRVHTMRNREEQRIRYISSYVRIGKMGQVVDNMHSGGTGARIYNDGTLRNAVSCYPYKTFNKTESGVNLNGYKILDYNKIIDTCIKAHSRLPMFDLIGWDVTVDKSGQVIIIEYNPNPDIRIEQAIFGESCLLENQEWVMHQYFSK